MSAWDRSPPLTANIRHGRSDQFRRRCVQHRGRCLSRHASKDGRRMRGASISCRTHAQPWFRQQSSSDAAHAVHGCNAATRSSNTERRWGSRQLESMSDAALPSAWLKPSTEVGRAGSACRQVICHGSSADAGREVRHHTAGSGRSAHRRVSLLQTYVCHITQAAKTWMLHVWKPLTSTHGHSLCRPCRYTDTGFLVNDVTVSGSLLCLRDLWMRWDVSTVAGVTPDSVAILFLLRPFPGDALTDLQPRPRRAATFPFNYASACLSA